TEYIEFFRLFDFSTSCREFKISSKIDQFDLPARGQKIKKNPIHSGKLFILTTTTSSKSQKVGKIQYIQ
ncbi:MAG: hypothetical protein AAGK05_19400, partial [Pseudomonadota bacterium]